MVRRFWANFHFWAKYSRKALHCNELFQHVKLDLVWHSFSFCSLFCSFFHSLCNHFRSVIQHNNTLFDWWHSQICRFMLHTACLHITILKTEACKCHIGYPICADAIKRVFGVWLRSLCACELCRAAAVLLSFFLSRYRHSNPFWLKLKCCVVICHNTWMRAILWVWRGGWKTSLPLLTVCRTVETLAK